MDAAQIGRTAASTLAAAIEAEIAEALDLDDTDDAVTEAADVAIRAAIDALLSFL